MEKFSYKNARVQINIETIELGNDLCVVIWGGDKPHLGTVILSTARPSLADKNRTSTTSSTINISGHKDDQVARPVSEILSAGLNKNVAVVCGIHIRDITLEEIQEIISVTLDWAESFVENSI
ncbi:MAG: hypothetical protein WCZ27_10355 [Tissierellaceae bacterium]